MRISLGLAMGVLIGLLSSNALTGQRALTPEPMRIDKVKESLYVIPGHGNLLTKDDVRAYKPKLETMNRRMTDLIRKGVPRDQVGTQLKLDDLGWAHTVSTGTFMASVGRYYDELAGVK